MGKVEALARRSETLSRKKKSSPQAPWHGLHWMDYCTFALFFFRTPFPVGELGTS
jgi:hypothetical protein